MTKSFAPAQNSSDEVRIKGILSKGYGQTAKIVMLDPALSLEAKAIYGYFCSYCGGGNTAFPGRARILADLKVNKDTYYKHFRMLTDHHYISACQILNDGEHRGFARNVYTIENFPPKYTSSAPEGASDALCEAWSKVKAAMDISAAGYGNVPKSVMTNENLSIQAKGLYAYLCSFCGKDFTASPSRDTILSHLRISHNSANKYMNQLIDNNFVFKSQMFTSGRFSGLVYYLNQMPESRQEAPEKLEIEQAVPSVSDDRSFRVEIQKPNISDAGKIGTQPEISDTEEFVSVSQPIISDSIVSVYQTEPDFSDTQREEFFPQPKKPDTVISETQPKVSDAQNSDINNTQNLNNIFYISPSFSQRTEESAIPEIKEKNSLKERANTEKIFDKIRERCSLPFEFTEDLNVLREAIRFITEWKIRSKPGYYLGKDAELQCRIYKLFTECLSEMLCKEERTYVKGSLIRYDEVYRCFTENFLDVYQDPYTFEVEFDLKYLIEDVIDAFMAARETRSISNSKAYLKTVIWTVMQDRGVTAYPDFTMNA